MAGHRFPLMLLLAAWVVIGAGLTLAFAPVFLTGNFPDTDDYMRLQQVRDLIAGQSWFDLTQHRVAPPEGLMMHWSRLVDIPLLLFVVPLTPLLGARAAETMALVGAPLLTLLALLVSVALIVRRLHGTGPRIALMAWLFAILPPLVFAQVHPGRIDHHGWQIALAAGVFAALLDPRPARSGVVAGVLTALFLAISIEGAPFAAAALGAVALLWAWRCDSGVRLTCYVQSLAAASVVANALLAPSSRWTQVQCDAVTTGHLAALVAAAVAVSLAVRLSQSRGVAVRLVALGGAALVTVAALYVVAPQCVGSPFGTMNPLVQAMWFENVGEGLPVWRQDLMAAVAALAFPVIGVVGSFIAVRGSVAGEDRRGWLLAATLGLLTLLTGALVYRAGGIAQIVAIPGALVIVERAVAWSGRRDLMLARVLSHAGAVLLFSPMGPLILAAMAVPATATPTQGAVGPSCDVDCAAARLNRLPATTLMNPIDLGPVLIARSHHRVYVASYHRLQGPLADTIGLFLGDTANAQAFMRLHRLRYIVIAPGADETGVYVKKAPDGLAAQLVAGRPPVWLRPIDFGGGKALLLFEVIQP